MTEGRLDRLYSDMHDYVNSCVAGGIIKNMSRLGDLPGILL